MAMTPFKMKKKPSKWIITSLLDTDFYKFTMGQVIFLLFNNAIANYVFRNRTVRVALGQFIDEAELRRQLNHVMQLRFKVKEIEYLRQQKKKNGESIFCEKYLQFLADLKLPAYSLRRDGDNLIIQFRGKWCETVYWETHGLPIANELYYRTLMSRLSLKEQETVYAEGSRRLFAKIDRLIEYAIAIITDFGTRRRFSREWHEWVVRTMSKALPKSIFAGTSNVYLAMKYGLKPIGTMAHEMFMGMSGIMHDCEETIRQSHNEVLEIWWNQYGEDLSIALTDTYGTDFFFQDMTPEQARLWRGLRQDSGNPFEFGEKAIAFYQKHGIDPMTKVLVFSDGLDLETIIALCECFKGRINVSFGWGTNLTNDLGFDNLSLVIKLMELDGHGTVKLSDNVAKAMGEAEDIAWFIKIFGYINNLYVECIR